MEKYILCEVQENNESIWVDYVMQKMAWKLDLYHALETSCWTFVMTHFSQSIYLIFRWSWMAMLQEIFNTHVL